MATSMAAVCPGCFRHKGGEIAVCPGCGYDAAASRSPLLLPVLTRLNQRYLVGRTLGKPGGFGVTYLGFDVTLRVSVAIKEYCPRELVGRDASRKTLAPHSQEDGEMFRFGLQAFLDEARTLAKFDHANVVRVRDFFEANGTAYLVMDYYEGESLLEYLARHGGTLPWRAALELMLPVLDGLREVHRRGFLHRDIKPHNIYLTTQGRPILLDFGSARQAMGERSRSLSVVLTEGYAPFEQYQSRGQQGPWTDIYGAAASLYLLLTGQTPPPAPERIRCDGLIPPRQLVPDLPPPLNAALINGLAMDVQQRPQTMEQFEEWLHGVAERTAPIVSKSNLAQPIKPLQISDLSLEVANINSQKQNLDYDEEKWDCFKAVIGPKNTDYYINKFKRIEDDNKSTSWNWAAFFLTFIWAAYRKMYLVSVGYFLILSMTGIMASIISENMNYLQLIYSPIFAIIANNIYFYHARRKIEKYKKRFSKFQSLIGALEASSGVSFIGQLLGAIPIIGILSAIAIPAYQDYSIREKITESLQITDSTKTAVTNFVMKNKAWPNSLMETDASSYPKSPNVDRLNYENGVIQIVLVFEPLQGKSILL